MKSTATEWGSSRWESYQRCEVEHALKYEPNRFRLPLSNPTAPARPRKGTGPNPLEVGRLVHAALEVVALNQKHGTENDWCEALLGEALDVFEAQRLVQRYLVFWGKDWVGFEVIEVEHPVAIAVGPMPWTTRLDVLLRDLETTRLVVVDHKTRGSMPSGGDDALRDEGRCRPQFLGAIAATRVTLDLDYNPDFIIDTIVKTKTPAYARPRFAASDSNIEAWVADQTRLAHRYVEGAVPVRNLHACNGKYSLCEFYDRCHESGT